MKTALSRNKHYRAAAAGILLTMVGLVIGGAACNGVGARTYQLTISSTSGGLVATPGEGTDSYGAGIVVQLVATPNEGYEFRSWSGDIAYIANPSAASTTITMNGNSAVVANFQAEGGTGPGGGRPYT